MATFKSLVRYKRADGFYQVYIRVLHHTKSGYIKTDKFVTDQQISKKGEIKDAVVNEYCAREILRYNEMINRHDISNYTVNELIEFLLESETEVCFSKYARQYINNMENSGHWKSHATLTLLAKQDLPTFGYNMIDPLKSWCWGSILFYPFNISRFS